MVSAGICSTENTMKIPRVFHQIWLGRQPMPPEFLKWQKTWKVVNPGWTLKLWNEDNLPTNQWPNLIAKAQCLSQRSDIFRYEILNREGGVYVGTDCECLKPIESLISNCDAFVVRKKPASSRDPMFNNATLGCTTGHPLAQALVNHLNEVDLTVKLSTASLYLSRIVQEYPQSVMIIPSVLMNPYNHVELDEGKPRSKDDFPDAYILHHWSSKWHPTGFAKLNSPKIL